MSEAGLLPSVGALCLDPGGAGGAGDEAGDEAGGRRASPSPLRRLKLRIAHSPLSRRRKTDAHAGDSSTGDPSLSEMSVDPWAGPEQREPQQQIQDQLIQDQQTEVQDPQQTQDQILDGPPDQLSLDSFWTEVENIQQGGGFTRPDSHHSEDGEQEERWLQAAGLSTLILEDSGSDPDPENAGLLSTLTRTQAAAVQRRLDSYTLSLRRRNKPGPRDVREVFTSAQNPLPESSESQESEDTPPIAMETGARVPPTGGSQREELFLTDVAFCEQAVLLLRQKQLIRTGAHRTRTREDGTLPRVVCPQGRLGVTRVQDLSPPDMKKVRQLALIDLTALCDLLELDSKRTKLSKKTGSDSALFGVPLATLLENDQKIKPSTSTPLILQELLSFLEKKGLDSEGILRVPGSQTRIKLLQQTLEAHLYSGGVVWEDVSPNDAAALLKKFIRELPSPLLTAEHLHTFSAVRDVPELKQKLHMLNLLIILLPEPNRHTLKVLLEFLRKVVSCEQRNRMTLWAVSTIMAPNLFLHQALLPSRAPPANQALPPSRAPLAPGPDKSQAERAAHTMRLLIRYQDLLWTIPNFLMSQVRKRNESSSRRYQFYDRRLKNLLKKISTDSKDKTDKNSSSEPCRTVKVQVVGHQSSIQVHLNTGSRASDLLSQFHRQLRLSPENSQGPLRNGSVHPDCAIYEVGGNIGRFCSDPDRPVLSVTQIRGEHCVDPEAHLLDLYNSNPGGEWVIRTKPASRGL